MKIIYKNWAFRFTIWLVLVNAIIFYFTINYVSFPGIQDNSMLRIFYLSVLAIVLLVLSLVFITISTIKKEEKNYKYWISIVCIFVFCTLPLIDFFITVK